ncbi:hypothetical protein [Bremerella cremea]|uniref:hypothetical protein n=1 Tax=Bremerella cremea TaxID=1031537 RepID=UPI0018F6B974|nr:hypothetical protein [Bremerella cremea]
MNKGSERESLLEKLGCLVKRTTPEGSEVSVEEATQAAERCAANVLRAVRAHIGTLELLLVWPNCH